jgi:hypothetical protein
MTKPTRSSTDVESRETPKSGLGVPCAEAQSDGVPCDEVDADCTDCDRARAAAKARQEVESE